YPDRRIVARTLCRSHPYALVLPHKNQPIVHVLQRWRPLLLSNRTEHVLHAKSVHEGRLWIVSRPPPCKAKEALQWSRHLNRANLIRRCSELWSARTKITLKKMFQARHACVRGGIVNKWFHAVLWVIEHTSQIHNFCVACSSK